VDRRKRDRAGVMAVIIGKKCAIDYAPLAGPRAFLA